MAKKIKIVETGLRDAHQSLIATRMPMSDMLPILGEMDKANAIMTKVADNCIEYLTWIDSLEKEHRAPMQSNFSHQLAVLNYVLQNLERHQQKELFNYYYSIFTDHVSKG